MVCHAPERPSEVWPTKYPIVPSFDPAIFILLAKPGLKYWVQGSDTTLMLCSFGMFVICTSEYTAAAPCVEGETKMVCMHAKANTCVIHSSRSHVDSFARAVLSASAQ